MLIVYQINAFQMGSPQKKEMKKNLTNILNLNILTKDYLLRIFMSILFLNNNL